jgi:hypothetical protein
MNTSFLTGNMNVANNIAKRVKPTKRRYIFLYASIEELAAVRR